MAVTLDVTDGPVLSLINKRIRALRKKHNRITQLEEAVTEGKLINKEQEDVLCKDHFNHKEADVNGQNIVDCEHALVEDLLNLLYCGSMFDVKSQNDYTSTMLTRMIEQGCCLTYDYVTDDDAAADLQGERDLDLIFTVGGRVISRLVDSSLSHKNALQRCVEHANLWLAKSCQPIQCFIEGEAHEDYESDYFTTTSEMKAPVEMAAVAKNYTSFLVPVNVIVQVEDLVVEYQQEVMGRDVTGLRINKKPSLVSVKSNVVSHDTVHISPKVSGGSVETKYYFVVKQIQKWIKDDIAQESKPSW